MRRWLAAGLLVTVTLPGPQAAAAETPGPSSRDRTRALLDYFRRLTLDDADRERLGRLIGQLDARSYAERAQASAALVAEGPRALPLLRPQKGATLEQKSRLDQCIKALENDDWPQTIAGAARRLKWLRPRGGAATLLAFVPYAPEDALGPVLAALCATGVHQGRVDPVIVAALEDRWPQRRAAAALVVGAFGTAEQRLAVRRLMGDPDADVRLRAAAGLLAAGDLEALPVLLALLEAEEPAVVEAAENLLDMAAGNAAPAVTSARDRRAAWHAWWFVFRRKPDLAVAALEWELLLDPRAPCLAGTVWGGVDGPEGWHTVYTFHPDGTLTYAYRSQSFSDGSWKQSGRKLTFEVNGRYVESSGVVGRGTIKFQSVNVKGVAWETTLTPEPRR